jgi:L-fucose isomerase-like protein
MRKLTNTPDVTMGLVAVSRDCFPIEMCRGRMKAVLEACAREGVAVVPCETIIENESDALAALAEMEKKGVNAVTIYLGNFGPEGPTTIFAREFGGPFMLVGAAEETAKDLINGRGDAFCGILNASFNCGLRHLTPHIPRAPIALPGEMPKKIARFADIARVLIGLRGLKVFSFGPRPQDFYACNAPIQPLYDLGIEVMENSELDLLEVYKAAAGRKGEIEAVRADMEKELGAGNKMPEKLPQLAQFEVGLTSFLGKNLGSRRYGVVAGKCWPSFEPAFGFTPCYVNSRLAARGIPAACEVDMYGAVSEYMIQLASRRPATLLDINNTAPPDLPIADTKGVAREDLFMGFHCGNTPTCMLCPGYAMKFQLIMHRLMEPGRKPDITCGTIEGRLAPGPATLFRLQSTPDCHLQSYMAQGDVLDADPKTFGSTGIIGIKDFQRFHRYVLIGKRFPHHGAVGFANCAGVLHDVVRLLGVDDISTPLPAGTRYSTENPFLE